MFSIIYLCYVTCHTQWAWVTYALFCGICTWMGDQKRTPCVVITSFFFIPFRRRYLRLQNYPALCDVASSISQLFVPHFAMSAFACIFTISLVILKLDLELIATEKPFAPNNYLSDPNQHIKSLPKSTRRKIVNLLEHFQLICIISKRLFVCVFWNVKKAQLKMSITK